MPSEKEIIEILHKSSTYSHEIKEKIKTIETNVSWIFLTGNYAYKKKKEIKFGDVLDFSSLNLRKKACEKEIILNKRLASEIYLEVVRLTEDGRINGNGDTIEYLVKMKELPQKNLLINIIKNQEKVDEKIFFNIVDLIKEFHYKNIIRDQISYYDEIYEKWDENFRTTRNYEGFPFSEKLEQRIYQFMEKNKRFWDTRYKENKVVDGHGDLQLSNIFIHKKKIIIFDCIEFNVNLRRQDMLEEISFLAMDLDYHDLSDISIKIMKRYSQLIKQDFSKIKPVYLLYKAYRAYVRAKVHYSSFLFGEKKEEKEQNKMKSYKYMRLADSYEF